MGKLCLALGLTGLRVFGFVTDPWLPNDDIHRVVGDAARLQRATAPGEALNVVTWNIERGWPTTPSCCTLTTSIRTAAAPGSGSPLPADGYRDIAGDLAEALA